MALWILASAIVPILIIVGLNITGVRYSVGERTVSLLVRQKLTEILTGEEETIRGDFADDGHSEVQWELSERKVEVLPPDDENGEPIGILNEFTLILLYKTEGKQRTMKIVTHLLEPEEPEEPTDEPTPFS